MATTAKESLVKVFNATYKNEYDQTTSLLQNTVTRQQVEGESAKITVMDSLEMERHNAGTKVTSKLIPARRVEIAVSDWEVTTMLPKVDLEKTNQNLIAMATQKLVAATKRREDQLIIDALAAETYIDDPQDNLTGGKVVVGTDSMTVAKIAKANEIFEERSAVAPGVLPTFLLAPKGMTNLMINEDKFTNQDYIDSKSVVDSGHKAVFWGDKFITIGKNGKLGGLPLTGTTRSNYLYNKEAVHVVYTSTPRVELTYLQDYGSHMLTAWLSMGVKVTLPAGVVEVQTLES